MGAILNHPLSENLIPEDELMSMAKQAMKDYKAGTARKLSCLADLTK